MSARSFLLMFVLGCTSSGVRRFPLRDPVWRDPDLTSVYVRCRDVKDKEKHRTCAPEPYKSPLYWDIADNSVFRPLSEVTAVTVPGEAVNVNSLDEVPDSSWFQNRLGVRPITRAELAMGGCSKEQVLDPETAADGSWVIDKGRDSGSTPGFRIRVPGKGKYYVKLEKAWQQPERQSAATVIGAAVMHAAGYNASCEQLLYVRPSLFRLQPGVTFGTYFTRAVPYDKSAFEKDLTAATTRDGLIRVVASAWIPGYVIGPYQFMGTRDDDPNDVVSHENRRELRALRLIGAWLERHDSREANTLDTWISDVKEPPDASPGHVVHYQFDTSDALGAGMSVGNVSRQLGKNYVIDWSNMATEFMTFGVRRAPWETAHVTPGHELFGYFNVRDFVPDKWKPEYPNGAFSRMSERDAAWMARILARFTPEMVDTLAGMGNFSDPAQTAYLASVLKGRLARILERYLTRVSSIADVRIEGSELCGVDLAAWRGIRAPSSFTYAARLVGGPALGVVRHGAGRICVALLHFAPDGGARDDDPSRYMRVVVTDGVALAPLVAHLYDLGPARGFKLVGLER